MNLFSYLRKGAEMESRPHLFMGHNHDNAKAHSPSAIYVEVLGLFIAVLLIATIFFTIKRFRRK